MEVRQEVPRADGAAHHHTLPQVGHPGPVRDLVDRRVEVVRLDAVLGTDAPAVSRLPWPLRLVPALGERWWPPVVVLLLTLATAYAGTRLAAHPRPRRTRLVVLGAVLLTGLVWLLAPWTLVVLVPGAFAVASVPLLLPGGAATGTTRERTAG